MGNTNVARIKIILITDAWEPQVNGVVTTYKNLINYLPDNVSVDIVHPALFDYFPFTLYKGINIPLCSFNMMYNLIERRTMHYQIQGYSVLYHIATEGVLGYKAKRALDVMKKPYTTAYHTKFPEFLKLMFGIPVLFTSWYFNWFHKKSKAVMCSSQSDSMTHSDWQTVVLGKGYASHFSFKDHRHKHDINLLYVGRVSHEKNIEDFCKLDLDGWTDCNAKVYKIIVGDGPARKSLEKKYPGIRFVGYKFGKDLASYYQNADVCVFPSKVDTFGITILESMACGTPVAGYPVTGPIDQIINGVNGYVDQDLESAVGRCLLLERDLVANSVKHISWKQSAQQFVDFIAG